VDVGQTVAASLQTPTLLKIAQDLSKMQIDANFAEADIGNVRANQAVHFTVDAFPNKNFQGVVRLVRLNPTNQQNVITYDVVINVSNPELILMPGMTAYVSIAVAERRNALIVPNAALRFKPADAGKFDIAGKSAGNQAASRGGKTDKPSRDGFSGRVYVLKNDVPVAVNVRTGITDNRNTEILSGEIKPGDQLITGEVQGDKTAQTSQPLRMRMF
jgi:HlyD family secretion protein